MTRYESAKAMYAKYGIDTDAMIAKLRDIPVSLHCWQGDDVIGFDHDGPLTGGIQTTGNYPGKAKTPDELFADMKKERDAGNYTDDPTDGRKVGFRMYETSGR